VLKIQRGYEIGVGQTPGLGSVLVDDEGRTLYLYVPDNQDHSVCAQICPRLWPPMVVGDGDTNGRFSPGVDAALVGAVRRTDGSL
jgi:predicted lipoprotein with Yx(FWY)xxD motif